MFVDPRCESYCKTSSLSRSLSPCNLGHARETGRTRVMRGLSCDAFGMGWLTPQGSWSSGRQNGSSSTVAARCYEEPHSNLEGRCGMRLAVTLAGGTDESAR